MEDIFVSGRTLLYQRIYGVLKGQIQSGYFKEGELIPTEKELIQQFHVSRATTNRALKQLTDEGLITRIPGSGTFVKEQTLPTHTSMTSEGLTQRLVGFVIPYVRDEYGLTLFTETERLLHEKGIHLVVSQSYGDLHEEGLVIDRLHHLGARGMIIFPTDGVYYNEILLRLYLAHVPMVIIDKPMPGVSLPLVMSDHTLGANMLMDHLLGLGHRHIALVSRSYDGNSTHRYRWHGYKESLERLKIPFNNSYCLELDSYMTKENEYNTEQLATIQSFLETHPEITAIFATQNQLAQHVLAAAKNLGRHVPESLSIACFDGPTVKPGQWELTHIVQDEAGIASEAVRILLQLLDGKASSHERILIPPRLHIGASTQSI